MGGVNINLNGWSVRELDKKDSPKQSDFGMRLAPPPKEGAKEKEKEKHMLFVAVATPDAAATWLERTAFAAALASPAVFGVPLRVAFAKGGHRRCPAVVSRMAAFLERNEALGMSGIFRVSAGQSEVMRLREAFNDGSDVEPLISEITDFNVASHLLKLYFRELPDPLLTHERYTAFVEAPTNVAKIAEICASLPREHLFTLQYLMAFLKKVAARSGDNMMNSRNLGVVFGPTILSPAPNSPAAASAATHTEPVIQVCQTMIDHYDEIFPPFERQAIADADRPRPRPAPIIAVTRDAEVDTGDGKKKDKSERRKSGNPASLAASAAAATAPTPEGPAAPAAPGMPMMGMPMINPGAVRLKPVAPGDPRRMPRPAGAEDGAQQEPALGPHMLKKSVPTPGGAQPAEAPANSTQAELMAKLAARSVAASAGSPAESGEAKPAAPGVSPRAQIEGRPMPQRKPQPQPPAHPGATFPGPRPPQRQPPPVAPRAPAKPVPTPGGAEPTAEAAEADKPAPTPSAVAMSQRRSMPPRSPQADEHVEALSSQVLELQNTVAKLTEQVRVLEEKGATATPTVTASAPDDARVVALEATVAEQGALLAKQEEQLKALGELVEKLSKKKESSSSSKKHSHSREKSSSSLKHHKRESSASMTPREEESTPEPPSDSPAPPPPPSPSE